MVLMDVRSHSARPRLRQEEVASVLGPGDILGRCRILSIIGRGSAGTVWEGWHTTLGIPVAVKILDERGDRAQQTRALLRFRQEAHLAGRLNHPSLVRVLDYGEDHHRPYLVMELVRGPTLENWLVEHRLPEERTALNVVGHLCIGLAALHHAGIVHRDLKPSNVLIEPGRSLKISDLGLAGSPDEGQGVLAGTPHYMAPECIRGEGGGDARSDLYSAGVILYRMLFGRHPCGGSVREVLHAQAWETPDWSAPAGRSLDAGTLFIARRLLEKDPHRRIQSAIEAIQACREQVARLDRRAVVASGPRRETTKGPSSGRKATPWARAWTGVVRSVRRLVRLIRP